MHKIWAVVRREFVERVRTKWFWVTTIIGPIFFGFIIVLPVVMARGGGLRRIAVVDNTESAFGAQVAADLSSMGRPGRGTRFQASAVPFRDGALDSLTTEVSEKRLDGFLILPADVIANGRAEYRGSNVSSLQAVEDLERGLNRMIVKARLEREGVNPVVVDRAQIRIRLDTKKIAGGRATAESAGGTFIMAYVMSVLLFMAILLYGVNVMSSVLEEKTSRVMEVLVSSLRPFEMMLGKVLGAGSVSFLQFLIWAASARLLISQRASLLRLFGADAQAASGFQMPPIPLATIAVFLAFFVGGFLLYSSLFAAVGAMSSTEQEARQAQQPVTFLLMISYLSIFGLTNDPNSTLSRTLSLIPFTAPIAMPVRFTAGDIGPGEVLLSLAILAAGIVAVTWIAARIYRVGILMTGKRPNVRELLRWVRTA